VKVSSNASLEGHDYKTSGGLKTGDPKLLTRDSRISRCSRSRSQGPAYGSCAIRWKAGTFNSRGYRDRFIRVGYDAPRRKKRCRADSAVAVHRDDER